jgi:predicted dehydrogenase
MTVGWGIVGPGDIAATFVRDTEHLPSAMPVAVASRSAARAKRFADAYGLRESYGDYRALADSPTVDVVYVATPHSCHEADVRLFLDAGKHVLCEKPLAVSAAEVQRMQQTAAANGVFLMEAMWTRFLPAYQRLRDLLSEGAIGSIQRVDAEFGSQEPFNPQHRLFRRDLGGGALLDVGVYPLQLVLEVLGPPKDVAAVAEWTSTGVDADVTVTCTHHCGGVSYARASLTRALPGDGVLWGTEGRIHLGPPMHRPTCISIVRGGERVELHVPIDGYGLHHQMAAVQEAIAGGATEVPIMSWEDSLLLACVVDRVRAAITVS